MWDNIVIDHMHRIFKGCALNAGIDGILRSDRTIKGIVGSNKVPDKPTSGEVTNVVSERLVRVVPSQALFWGANIDLIVLEPQGLLNDVGNDPGSMAEACALEAQSEDEQDIGDGTVNTSNGEGTRGILPCDGRKDRGDDGTVEAKVEEGLGTVRNTKDVVTFTRRYVEASDGTDGEETAHDGQLTTNHETGEVASVTTEEDLTGLLSEIVRSALLGRELGHTEEGNLHGL